LAADFALLRTVLSSYLALSNDPFAALAAAGGGMVIPKVLAEVNGVRRRQSYRAAAKCRAGRAGYAHEQSRRI
jgi:hypothetical protein